MRELILSGWCLVKVTRMSRGASLLNKFNHLLNLFWFVWYFRGISYPENRRQQIRTESQICHSQRYLRSWSLYRCIAEKQNCLSLVAAFWKWGEFGKGSLAFDDELSLLFTFWVEDFFSLLLLSLKDFDEHQLQSFDDYVKESQLTL